MENVDKIEIQGAIVEAIAFFDIFNRAITPFEIWQSIKIKCSLEDVINQLELAKELKISQKNSYFFLEGREDLVDKKNEQYNLSNFKTEIAKKAVRILRFINGVKMVAICNNFYYKKESDVDLFIVVSKNRMWLTRILATVILHLLGMRVYKNNVADMICLSFYVTEDNLDLKKIEIDNYDPYLYYWFSNLIPLYNAKMYNSFFKENSYFRSKLPNAIFQKGKKSEMVNDNIFSTSFKFINNIWFKTIIGDMLENILRHFQLKRIFGNKDNCNNDNSSIIVSDKMLKFHKNDRRKEFREKLKIKIENYL